MQVIWANTSTIALFLSWQSRKIAVKQRNYILKKHAVTLPEAYAALDLGSNSFHCFIVKNNSQLSTLAHMREAVRLRSGVDERGLLAADVREKALSVLTKFRSVLDDYGVASIRVVGTQAFRLLSEEDDFISQAEQTLRAPIQVLDGLEEAFAIYRGVVSWPAVEPGATNLILDIGGGSTECIYGVGVAPLEAVSMLIGGVELMERIGPQQQILREVALDEMEEPLRRFKGLNWSRVVLTSGMGEVLEELALSYNRRITPDFLNFLSQIFAQKMTELCDRAPSLTSDRRLILPATLAILLAFTHHLDVSEIQLSSKALRHGVLLELCQAEHPVTL